MLCHAHAQLDDSFDEEYEVANYNLTQVAELEAARRIQAAALTQNPCDSHGNNNYSSVNDPMQIDNIVNGQSQHFHQYHHGNYQLPVSNHTLAPVNTSRKLKRGCEFDNASTMNNAEFDRSNKRIKAAF